MTTCYPIIIPTLNRIDYFSKCIESLASCDNAINTPVYIGLDYPPNDMYVDGYNKICEYLSERWKLDIDLSEKQYVEQFLYIKVLRAKSNLGAFSNSGKLINTVKNDGYAGYIFSEDDNVFAKYFLRYMNKSLEKTKTNRRIMAVSGYMWPVNLSYTGCNSIMIDSIFSAWGYGILFENYTAISENLNVDFLTSLIRNYKLMSKLKKTNPFIYVEFIKSYLEYSGCLIIDGTVQFIDLFLSIWSFSQGMATLYPIKSLVRNMGNDGSGNNCVDIEFNSDKSMNNRNINYSIQEIDEDCCFDKIESFDIDSRKKANNSLNSFFYVSRKELIRADICVILIRFLGRKILKKVINRKI